MKFDYVYLSRTGQKRTENEDSFGVFPVDGGILAIVCDGLGGNKAGEIASQLTVDTIHAYFKDSKISDILEKIKQSVAEANRVLLEKSSSDYDLKGMATTVEVLFIRDNTAYWGHVGDSRIYHFKSGKLKQLTKDHSLVQKLVDEGYLTLKEAENHPNKNIIMRALGDNNKIEVDVSKVKLGKHDDHRFFICSDGVTCVINDDELQQLIERVNPRAIGEKLSRIVEDRGAPDNYTFVLISKSE